MTHTCILGFNNTIKRKKHQKCLFLCFLVDETLLHATFWKRSFDLTPLRLKDLGVWAYCQIDKIDCRKFIEESGTMSAFTDTFKWTRYSSLQKWIILLLAAGAVSWLLSLWLLLPLFLTLTGAGFKFSEEVVHNKKISHVAEMLFYKIESCYLKMRALVKNQKRLLWSGIVRCEAVSDLPPDIIMELNSSCEMDHERSVDSFVKLSAVVEPELTSIQLLILRDFVKSWYVGFSYDPQFLKEARFHLQEAFHVLVEHIARQDPMLLLTRVLKLYHFHFTLYQRACNTFQSHKIHPKMKVREDVSFRRHSSIDDAFENATVMHPALESEVAELSYLRGIVSMIVLSTCNTHVVECPFIKTLLIQILTNKVILPVMKIISNPDWIMEVIIQITSDTKADMTCAAGRVAESGETSSKGKQVCKAETQLYKDSSCTLATTTNKLHKSPEVQPWRQPESSHISDSDLSYILQEHNLTASSKDFTSPPEAACSVLLDSSTSHQPDRSTSHQPDRSTSHQPDSSTSHQPDRSASHKPDSARSDIFPTGGQDDMDSDSATAFNSNQPAMMVNGACGQMVSDTSDGDETLVEDISLTHNYCSEETDALSLIKEIRGAHLVDCDPDICIDDEAGLYQCDPQKIVSYSHRLLPLLTGSDLCSLVEPSSDSNPRVSESDMATSTFPKFFQSFVDSLKPNTRPISAKKPKTLSFLSDAISSNFNPLSRKKNVPVPSYIQQSKEPPHVLVDGVPLTHFDSEEDAIIEAEDIDEQGSTVDSDTEMTPSPGFFASMNSLFSFSTYHEMMKPSDQGGQKLTPSATPSPTSQFDFNMGSSPATIKNSCELRPFHADDRKIFQDVGIPSALQISEFRSAAQYSLYNIEYEALYFTEEGKPVLRSGKVRRRYREFLSLQSRLESHPEYKKCLKSLKVPKRWPTIPFKSVDKATVEARRLFLEKYLKDLIEIEAVCNSPDMRQFLAYEGDSHIAFVKSSPDISMPRLDKMIMRSFSGAFNKFKALPIIPNDIMGLKSRDAIEETQGGGRVGADLDIIDVNMAYEMKMISETSNLLPMTCLQVLQDLDTEDDKDLIHQVMTDPRNVEQANEAFKLEIEQLVASLPTSQVGSSVKKDSEESFSLSETVLDLLVQGLHQRDHWICRERVVKSMRSVLGKALNRYLENSVSTLIAESELANYLKILREAIWPKGQLRAHSSTPKTEEQKVATRILAKRCLVNFFPDSLRFLIGHQEFDQMIGIFLNSLEIERMNRHLLYQILDLLVEQIFSEVSSADFLHCLLFSRPRSPETPDQL